MLIDPGLTTSQTLQFSLQAAEMKRQGRDIISLGLGEPEFDTPDHIKEAACAALAEGLTRYSQPAGLSDLRELVAGQLAESNGIPAEAGEVLITPGAKNALFIACAAILRPGDEVINLNPCYVSNIPILKLAEPQVVVHNVPMIADGFTIDVDRVARLVSGKTRLIFINYPNNPTGKMLDPAEAQFLRDVVSGNDLYLLSDEIYERITFGETAHISPASFEDIRDQTITVSGFSKAYAMTGWRIGYLHTTADVLSVMLKIHQQINTNTAAFIQKAAAAALSGPQDHLVKFLADLQERKALYDGLLRDSEPLSGSDPTGGFFGFVNISATGLTSDEFATRLLDATGVAVIPGISFGEDFDGYCRISLVNHTEVVREGLERIRGFVDEKVAR